MGETISRRGFLTGAGIIAAGVAAGGLAACSPQTAKTEAGGQATAAVSSVQNWLGTEPSIAESAITETVQTDILIIGAGTAGLFAACSAVENGARTLVIEKEGGSPGVRGTLAALNSRLQIEEGCVIDKLDIARDLTHYAASHCDPRLYQLWAEESAETVNWYEKRLAEKGATLMHDSDADTPHTNYQHWATGHTPSFMPEGLTAGKILLSYAQEKGAEFRYNTPMVKIEKENGRVTGVIAQNEETKAYVRIKASKGVLVCTGGYARNSEMLNTLQPYNTILFSNSSAIPGTEGDGIKACIWAGADFDDVHTSMLFDRGVVKPDEISGQSSVNMLFWMGSQPWLKVNLNSERFANESSPYDFILHASRTQPGHTYCTIWDSNYVNYIYQFKTQGCSRMFNFVNGAPPNAMPLAAAQGMNAKLLEQGYIQQANTIEELAQKLNIPVDTFKKTVARNNELYKKGKDEDFGKEAFRLSPIDTPPYFGVRQTGSMLCTLDGIRIDQNVNAVDTEGKPISGLYVCGNDSGGYYAYTYPDVSAGNAAGRTATFARRAARIAAKS